MLSLQDLLCKWAHARRAEIVWLGWNPSVLLGMTETAHGPVWHTGADDERTSCVAGLPKHLHIFEGDVLLAGLSGHLLSLSLDGMDDILSPAQMLAMCSLTQLTQLRFSNDEHTDLAALHAAARLPSQISQLGRLQELSFAIEEADASVPIFVPPELAHIQSLAFLSLSGVAQNGLTPIGRLSGLTYLKVSAKGENLPLVLPESCPGLTRLQILDIDGCHLEGNVQVLTHLSALSALKLVWCCFGASPEEAAAALSNFQGLTQLDVSQYMIPGLPAALPALHQLIRLDISDTDLDRFEVQPHDLQRLEELILRGNQMHSMPIGISQLASLRTLSMQHQHGCAFQVQQKLRLWHEMPALHSVNLQQPHNHTWNMQSIYCLTLCEVDAKRWPSRCIEFLY